MIKSLFSSAHAWLKRNPLLVFVVLVAYVAISKHFGVADSVVSKILCFVLSGAAVLWIDKQLPRRRWRTFAILLSTMTIIFISYGIYKFAIKQLPLGDEVWILGIVVLLSGGYGIYALWRLRRSLLWYNDIRLQRELRARCGRK